MIKNTTVGDSIAKKSYFEKLSSGYDPILLFHPYDLEFIYKYGRLPKKLKKLHNIYTLR